MRDVNGTQGWILFVFDVSPYLTGASWKIGYHATNVAFALLPLIYGWGAWAGGAP